MAMLHMPGLMAEHRHQFIVGQVLRHPVEQEQRAVGQREGIEAATLAQPRETQLEGLAREHPSRDVLEALAQRGLPRRRHGRWLEPARRHLLLHLVADGDVELLGHQRQRHARQQAGALAVEPGDQRDQRDQAAQDHRPARDQLRRQRLAAQRASHRAVRRDPERAAVGQADRRRAAAPPFADRQALAGVATQARQRRARRGQLGLRRRHRRGGLGARRPGHELEVVAAQAHAHLLRAVLDAIEPPGGGGVGLRSHGDVSPLTSRCPGRRHRPRRRRRRHGRAAGRRARPACPAARRTARSCPRCAAWRCAPRGRASTGPGSAR